MRPVFVSRKKFEEFFADAMKSNVASDGRVTFLIEPKMVIRDFNRSEGCHVCDFEFIDLEKAYAFFKETDGACRVMNATGFIYSCMYDDVNEEVNESE